MRLSSKLCHGLTKLYKLDTYGFAAIFLIKNPALIYCFLGSVLPYKSAYISIRYDSHALCKRPSEIQAVKIGYAFSVKSKAAALRKLSLYPLQKRHCACDSVSHKLYRAS